MKSFSGWKQAIFRQRQRHARHKAINGFIELLTQASNNKQNIKCLNVQVVPEEINKANKTICFHSVTHALSANKMVHEGRGDAA